jgi:hypothetical protein
MKYDRYPFGLGKKRLLFSEGANEAPIAIITTYPRRDSGLPEQTHVPELRLVPSFKWKHHRPQSRDAGPNTPLHRNHMI